MTELKRDAAYVRTDTRTQSRSAQTLTAFDEEVYELLSSPHTVVSATKTLTRAGTDRSDDAPDAKDPDLESRVADAMLHLLEAERIELSPDS